MWPPSRSGHDRPGALVRNVRQLDAGLDREIFARDMADRADAGRSEVDLAGIGLRVRDQVADRARGIGRVHHQRGRRDADPADRLEVLARIEPDVVVERRADAERAGVDQRDHAAVGRTLGDHPHADGAARAAAVVDDDRLAERFAELVGKDARDDVGAAARRERHDHGDRARGAGLCLRRGAAEKRGACTQQRQGDFQHRRFLPVFACHARPSLASASAKARVLPWYGMLTTAS